MRKSRRLLSALVLIPLALTALTACQGGKKNEAKTTPGTSGGYTFAVVTHGGSGDAFWTVVKNGAMAAGKQMGDKVTYSSSGDPQQQSQLIDAAVNQKVDGLVVSMANPDALKSSVTKAVAAGIPVITINSGAEDSAAFGAIAHVGQDETVAGKGAGDKLGSMGAHHVLCVIHEAGNVGLEQRCAGAKAGLTGGTVENLQVDLNNPQAAQSTIQAKLQSDKSVDGVLTLNAQVASFAVAAVKGAGSKAKVATFDLNTDVAKAVESGDIAFAVDQQQYTQGYLPIVLLTLYKQNLNTLGGGQPILTGPGFVTKDNAAQVEALTEKGTR
ncbi:sugar ABC transporter substrate-binding protein [Rugosimonospora africana]|uniref:Sugar ABC transporter substrate-binding protein n=1 Tax=Rugosimonospora africana TaxID=556532 RepID=A0A8J3QUP9_9ACTN|nr:sugar ABC transporter substrate-binding protein [Rugosimonospora africana]GIH16442.1 sugar ABC transporter substrate-binding protein [Rugosimonospora africana]